MYKWALLGILILALFLRLTNLAALPGGFTPDEASFGYDAYSLLKTGHDQWGYRYPLTFKSFGDYKLPVYTYLVMPSIYIFGLNEFAVRVPNALLGSAAVLFTVGVTLEITKNKKMALFSGFLLAISYWHIAMSRGAFEANLTTFFMTAGVYYFLKAQKKDIYLTLSMLFFGINLFTYHAARIVTPLIVMALIWFYRKSFPSKKKYLLASLMFLVPFAVAILSVVWGNSGLRAQTSTIFSQNLGAAKIRTSLILSGLDPLIARVFYNEPLFKVSKLAQNYSSYFSLDFLFNSGAREATYGMVPGMGVLSAIEFSGLILFVLQNIKKFNDKYKILVFWFIISFLPAAISVGPGNAANRAEVVLPTIQMFSAIGIIETLEHLRYAKLKRISFPFVLLFTAFISSIILFRYVIEQPFVSSRDMMYGMRSTFSYLKTVPDEQIVLSRSLSEAHIYAMFYDPIAPNLAQSASQDWDLEKLNIAWVDQQGTYFIGRYTITEPQKTRFEDNTLVVARPDEIPKGVKIRKTINGVDNFPIIVIAEKQ